MILNILKNEVGMTKTIFPLRGNLLVLAPGIDSEAIFRILQIFSIVC
jgi:hypothetical protein